MTASLTSLSGATEPRNTHILDRLLTGQRLTALAREYGISKQRIHQIVHNFQHRPPESREYQAYQQYLTMKTTQKAQRKAHQTALHEQREIRARRNATIRSLRSGGMTVERLAHQFSLSPQQIYYILTHG